MLSSSVRVFVRSLLVIISVVVSANAAGPGAAAYIGDWFSVTLNGPNAVNNDPQCVGMFWTERHINLEAVPGNPNLVRGAWVRTLNSMWMATKGLTCTWPGEASYGQARGGYATVLAFSIKGTYDPKTGVLRVNGVYEDCHGLACENGIGADKGMAPKTDKDKNFTTELKLQGDGLVDTNLTPDPSDDVEFVAGSVADQRKAQAMESLKPLLRYVDAGDVDSLYAHMSSSFRSNTVKEQMNLNLKRMHEALGIPKSRSLVSATYALYAPLLSKASGNHVLIINGLFFGGNRSTLEYIVMVKEEGVWTMDTHYVVP